MQKIIPTATSLLIAASISLLAGCAVGRTDAPALYDLGPMRTQPATSRSTLPPISIADVRVPAWLDSTMIFYRLNYANGQQLYPYAQARWTMTPADLLSQHLKQRLSQSGGIALSASDGAANVPMLRIEADDFTQTFDAPAESSAQVGLRASVFKGRALVAQTIIHKRAPAPSADAAGGASALAAASDAAIADIIAWLGTLDLK